MLQHASPSSGTMHAALHIPELESNPATSSHWQHPKALHCSSFDPASSHDSSRNAKVHVALSMPSLPSEHDVLEGVLAVWMVTSGKPLHSLKSSMQGALHSSHSAEKLSAALTLLEA